MKTKHLATMVFSMFATIQLAMAGEVLPPKMKEPGKNEPIEIEYLKTVWGYRFEQKGFYSGIGTVVLIPVTQDSAHALDSLNRKSRYRCILNNAIFVSDATGQKVWEYTRGTYYVYDINCN